MSNKLFNKPFLGDIFGDLSTPSVYQIPQWYSQTIEREHEKEITEYFEDEYKVLEVELAGYSKENVRLFKKGEEKLIIRGKRVNKGGVKPNQTIEKDVSIDLDAEWNIINSTSLENGLLKIYLKKQSEYKTDIKEIEIT